MLIFNNNYNAKLRLNLIFDPISNHRHIVVIEAFTRLQNIPETHWHSPFQRWNPYSGRGRGTIRRSVVACTPPVRTCRRERIG